jgi:hypothetical protein
MPLIHGLKRDWNMKIANSQLSQGAIQKMETSKSHPIPATRSSLRRLEERTTVGESHDLKSTFSPSESSIDRSIEGGPTLWQRGA